MRLARGCAFRFIVTTCGAQTQRTTHQGLHVELCTFVGCMQMQRLSFATFMLGNMQRSDGQNATLVLTSTNVPNATYIPDGHSSLPCFVLHVLAGSFAGVVLAATYTVQHRAACCDHSLAGVQPAACSDRHRCWRCESSSATACNALGNAVAEHNRLHVSF